MYVCGFRGALSSKAQVLQHFQTWGHVHSLLSTREALGYNSIQSADTSLQFTKEMLPIMDAPWEVPRNGSEWRAKFTLHYISKTCPLTCTIGKRNWALMIPHLRYQYHCQSQCHCCLYQSLVTCTNTQHVDNLKWVCICETGIVFSNSKVRMRIVTLSFCPSISGNFSWRAHNTKAGLVLRTGSYTAQQFRSTISVISKTLETTFA
jgi:hypothetical protein